MFWYQMYIGLVPSSSYSSWTLVNDILGILMSPGLFRLMVGLSRRCFWRSRKQIDKEKKLFLYLIIRNANIYFILVSFVKYLEKVCKFANKCRYFKVSFPSNEQRMHFWVHIKVLYPMTDISILETEALIDQETRGGGVRVRQWGVEAAHNYCHSRGYLNPAQAAVLQCELCSRQIRVQCMLWVDCWGEHCGYELLYCAF